MKHLYILLFRLKIKNANYTTNKTFFVKKLSERIDFFCYTLAKTVRQSHNMKCVIFVDFNPIFT